MVLSFVFFIIIIAFNRERSQSEKKCIRSCICFQRFHILIYFTLFNVLTSYNVWIRLYQNLLDKETKICETTRTHT